jgi:hypothetical protein
LYLFPADLTRRPREGARTHPEEAVADTCDDGQAGDRQIYGCAAAAPACGHTPFRSLTGDEYLSLAAMAIAPDTFPVCRYPAANAERTRRVRLVVNGSCIPRPAPVSYFPSLYKDR